MGVLYLACTFNLDEAEPIAGFGYEGIPAGDYIAPVGAGYLRTDVNNAEVVASPGNEMELTPGHISGGYEPIDYQGVTSSPITVGSGPAFGVYAYYVAITTRFVLPTGMTGETTAFAKIECGSDVGIEYVFGGGAGHVAIYDEGPDRAVELDVLFHTNETGNIAVTRHLIAGGSEPPEAAAFWTSFVGSREIV